MFTIPGVVLIEMSQRFGVDTYKIGYALTFFTIGTSSSAFFSGYMLKKIDFKKFLYTAYFIIAVGLAGTFLSTSILIFELFLLVSGLGIGVLIAASNYSLVKLYEQNERRFKISMLNFFYGFGSIICPFLISWLLNFNINWQQFYLLLTLFILSFAVILYRCDTGIMIHNTETENKSSGHFSLMVISIGAAMFFYVISEVTFTTWVVTYMRESLHWNIYEAGQILSFFWIFMAAGRLISGFAADKIRLEVYILFSMLASLGSIILFLNLNNAIFLYITASLAGLAYSALYPSILTFGTSQIENIPPQMVTFFITMGAAGSLAAFPISSLIKQYFPMHYVISSCIIFMIIAIILILPAALKKTAK